MGVHDPLEELTMREQKRGHIRGSGPQELLESSESDCLNLATGAGMYELTWNAIVRLLSGREVLREGSQPLLE